MVSFDSSPERIRRPEAVGVEGCACCTVLCLAYAFLPLSFVSIVWFLANDRELGAFREV